MPVESHVSDPTAGHAHAGHMIVLVPSKPDPLEEPLAAQKHIPILGCQSYVAVPPVLRHQLPLPNQYSIGRSKFVAVVLSGIFGHLSGIDLGRPDSFSLRGSIAVLGNANLAEPATLQFAKRHLDTKGGD